MNEIKLQKKRSQISETIENERAKEGKLDGEKIRKEKKERKKEKIKIGFRNDDLHSSVSYSCISNQFDSVFLSSLLDGPLPINFDSIDDPVRVEAVDGRRQVVQPLPLRDQRTERLRREGVPAQRRDDLEGRVLRADGFEVGLNI